MPGPDNEKMSRDFKQGDESVFDKLWTKTVAKEVSSRSPEAGEPLSQKTGEEILAKLNQIEERLDRIFGDAVLIRGRFISLSNIIPKQKG